MASISSDSKHRDLYKSKSAPWKDVYRQKCMARLKRRREEKISERRNLQMPTDVSEGAGDPSSLPATGSDILEVMEHEWENMKSTGFTGTDLEHEQGFQGLAMTSMLMVDDILAMFEEVKREMGEEKTEENQHLFDTYIRQEEAELCHFMTSRQTCQVICPLCERHNLIQHKFMILCRCGLSINTGHDCISLKNIHDNLQMSTTDHSNQCEEKPIFSYAERFGISNLLMACEKCDFLSIIV